MHPNYLSSVNIPQPLLFLHSPLRSHTFCTTSFQQLLFTLLRLDCQPPGMLLPVDMQSTSSSNQYFSKVVTNGPQGEESTLNTYKASSRILPGHWECHILFSSLVSAKLQLQYNAYEMEIQPIHLAFIVSLVPFGILNKHNIFTNT